MIRLMIYLFGNISYLVTMFFRVLLCVCLVFQGIHGKTEEEIRTWFFRQALECNKDHPVTPDELQILQKHQIPEGRNAKCLTACVFKKANYMDDKGMFNVEGATAKAVEDHAGDATKVENSKKLMEICKKVNNEEVSDGEAGCDRALLLFHCFREHAPQLGFSLQIQH